MRRLKKDKPPMQQKSVPAEIRHTRAKLSMKTGKAIEMGFSWVREKADPVVIRTVEELLAELGGLVGLDTVKDHIQELMALVQFNMQRKELGLPEIGEQSLHMAFLGNPGTGKTVVARIVGELLVAMGAIKGGATGKVVKEVSRADLVGEYVGHTAVLVKQAVENAFGGVLFVDEAYSLVQGDKDAYGHEAVDTLIKEMEDHRDKVVVILAGYQTEMSDFLSANPGFKSRIAFNFAFPDYTCDSLVKIGERELKKKRVALSEDAATCSSPQASLQ